MKRTLSALALFAALAGAASAQKTQFESAHTDVEVAYENNQLVMGWHDDLPVVGGEEKPAEDWYLFQGSAALTTRADQSLDGAAYNFIGAGANDPIYYFPSFTTTDVTLLGASAEEVPSGIFGVGKPGGSSTYFPEDTRTGAGFQTGQNIQFKLVGFDDNGSGGQFSFFKQYGAQVRNWMSTGNGLDGNDAVYTLAGLGHTDYDVAFTKAGVYDLTFVASGYVNGSRVSSDPTTFRFAIDAQPVPEPASFAALGVGALAFLRRRKVR